MKHARSQFGSLRAASASWMILLLLFQGLVAQPPDKRQRADALFEEGRRLVEIEKVAELRTGLEKLREARRLYAELGSREDQAYCLSHIGNAHRFLGELPEAIKAWSESLDMSTAVPDAADRSAMISTLTGNLGAVYQMVGEFGKAIEMFDRARKLAIDLKDNTLLAQLLSSSSMVYSDLGEYDKALAQLSEALKLVDENADPDNAALFHNNVAMVHFARMFNRPALAPTELPKAAESLVKAFKLLQRSCTAEKCNRLLTATVLMNLGKVFEMDGSFDEALKMYDQAGQVADAVGDLNLKAKVVMNIGSVFVLKKDLSRSVEYLYRALPILEITGDRTTKAIALASTMWAWREMNNPRLGIYYGKQAIGEYQKLRGTASSFDKATREKYLSNIEPVYRMLAGLLVAEGRISEAEQVLAMLKEEEVLDFVRRDDKVAKDLLQTVSLSDSERAAVTRYQKLATEIAALGKEFGELDQERKTFEEGAFPKQARYDELKKTLADATTAFQKFLDELKIQFGQRDERVVQVDSSLKSTLQRIKADRTAVISTIVGEKRLNLIFTSANVQRAHTVDVSAAEINELVAQFRAALTDPSVDPRPTGQKLYDILVKPVEGDLAGIKAETIIWSLDGTLRYIPTAALWDKQSGYLAERFANGLLTLASRETLGMPILNRSDRRALGVGVSKETEGFAPLAAVPDELDCIVKDQQAGTLSVKPVCKTGIIDGRKLLNERFTFSAFESALGRYPIVHIASHFNLNPGSDQDSFLLLGGGDTRKFTVEDLRNVSLTDVDLIVLSACNTATPGGPKSNGVEIEGFGAVSQRQGARSVLATLWPVADESTRDLMIAFYKEYAVGGATKAEAIRKAQRSFIDGTVKPSGNAQGCRAKKFGSGAGTFKCDPNAPFTHPYFWAPFVLIGDWR